VISSVSSIACSGLTVATRRLEQSANNVANLETDNFAAQREQASALAPAGVGSAPQPTSAPHPVAIDDGGASHLLSNTDLISETTERLGATQAFRANLAVLRTDDEMTRSLLDIKA
jgi:flagellar basal body rod protein FlgC